MRRLRKSFSCPHCGGNVPSGALACPGCGSDAESGWSTAPDAWAGDLPTGYGDEDELDYQEFLRNEGLGGDGRPSRRALRRQRWVATAVVLVICALLWLVMR